MIYITVSTPINAPYTLVCDHFNEALFYSLTPVFPPVRLLKYEGEQPGDTVAVQLWFFGLWLTWETIITERSESDEETYFVDESTLLPWFLKSWRHKHIIQKQGEGTLIIDQVNFEPVSYMPAWFLKLGIRKQFLRRRPLYQKYFEDKKA